MMEDEILRNEERAMFALRRLYRNYGYQRYKMSRFEEYDLYVRNKDFLVSDEIITFTDRSGRLLAMKPDVTLSIIKNTADQNEIPEKQYYEEHVYRMDPSTNTFKEILQTGLECVGHLTEYEIGEVVLLAVKSLALLGERFLLNLSDMGLVSEILEDSGLSEVGKQQAQLFLQQKNVHELDALCRKENISPDRQHQLAALVTCSGAPDTVENTLFPILEPDKRKKLNNLLEICWILRDCGFGDKVRVDFSVGNDMRYYSGVVFKGYLEGIPVSVLSGGQYDKLLRKMGRSSSAIGFAIYVDLLENRGSVAAPEIIDTLILHDGSLNAEEMVAITENAVKNGSVLVSVKKPEGRIWRKLIRIERGEVLTDG